MFIKMEKHHIEEIKRYLEAHGDEVIYFVKPFEQMQEGNVNGTFYGFNTGHGLEGLFYFSITNALVVHYENVKVLGNLSLLKAIKYHRPRFIKGLKEQISGIERILCRAVRSMNGVDVLLMVYGEKTCETKLNLQEAYVENYEEKWFKDMRFFIEVENHFGRQVLSVGDMARSIKQYMERQNYVLKTNDNEVIAQGLIEEECEKFAIIGGIYVSAQYRKKGIGREITLKLTQRVINRGKSVFLFVKNNNVNAKNIYENIGYHTSRTFTILSIHY